MVQSQPYKLLNKENKCLTRVSEQVFGKGNRMVLNEDSDLLNYLTTNQVKLKQKQLQFSRSEPSDLMCNVLYFLFSPSSCINGWAISYRFKFRTYHYCGKMIWKRYKACLSMARAKLRHVRQQISFFAAKQNYPLWAGLIDNKIQEPALAIVLYSSPEDF